MKKAILLVVLAVFLFNSSSVFAMEGLKQGESLTVNPNIEFSVRNILYSDGGLLAVDLTGPALNDKDSLSLLAGFRHDIVSALTKKGVKFSPDSKIMVKADVAYSIGIGSPVVGHLSIFSPDAGGFFLESSAQSSGSSLKDWPMLLLSSAKKKSNPQATSPG